MTEPKEPTATAPAANPTAASNMPPMPLQEFLSRAAWHFQQWLEDFQDYAEDYMDEDEARERLAELEEMTALGEAASYWAQRGPQ